jgi:hypothetical protein
MPRSIYIVVYASPLFPAHWAVWIPSLAGPDIGKRIHVSGDVHKGFEHGFERNYNLAGTGRAHTLIPIGEVGEDYVTDTPLDGQLSVDRIPRDQLERVALTIPAPGPSMNSASRSAVGCQLTLFQLLSDQLLMILDSPLLGESK